jgi:hypothetical protein
MSRSAAGLTQLAVIADIDHPGRRQDLWVPHRTGCSQASGRAGYRSRR